MVTWLCSWAFLARAGLGMVSISAGGYVARVLGRRQTRQGTQELIKTWILG